MTITTSGTFVIGADVSKAAMSFNAAVTFL